LLTLLLLLPLAGSVQADPAHSPILPDPTMTPGDVLTTDAQVVCQPGYARSVRNVPQSVKNQVYRQYGVTSRQPHEYEVDHVRHLTNRPIPG
jgi:hypothetical protein